MAEVALGDFVAFCYIEATRAREIADAYTVQLARSYAADTILKHFPAPRFRVANLRMVLPVTVTRPLFDQAARFVMDYADFEGRLTSMVDQIRRQLLVEADDVTPDDKAWAGRGELAETARAAVRGFFDELTSSMEPTQPGRIVDVWWPQVVDRESAAADWTGEPIAGRRRSLTAAAAMDLKSILATRVVIDRSTVNGLLVDPVTHAVSEAAQGSVLRFEIELIEEGLRLNTVRDELSGKDFDVVDFD